MRGFLGICRFGNSRFFSNNCPPTRCSGCLVLHGRNRRIGWRRGRGPLFNICTTSACTHNSSLCIFVGAVHEDREEVARCWLAKAIRIEDSLMHIEGCRPNHSGFIYNMHDV